MKLKNPPGLKGALFSEEEKEIARRDNKLLFISLMTNSVCNLECPDCYVGNKKITGNELSLDERIDILKQSKNLGAKTLRIAGEGEPLLDKDFFSIIDYASNKLDLDVFFFTNGTLIDKDIASKLYENKKITVVTKFSGTPDIMEKITGNKRYFTRDNFIEFDNLLIPNNLKYLIDAGLNESDGNSRLGIEFLLRKSNYGYAMDIFRWCRRNNVIPYIEQCLEAGSALDWKNYKFERVSDKDAFFLSKQLLEIDKTEFGYDWMPSIPYLVVGICETEVSGCRKFTYNIVVYSTGDVYPCYSTYIKLGNIRENPLSEILEHPYRKELLQNPRYNCLCKVFSRTNIVKDVESPSDLDVKLDFKDKY